MRQKLTIIPLFLSLLAGCQALQVQWPKTSKEKISYIRASTAAVEQEAIELYNKNIINKEIADEIYKRAEKVYATCNIVEALIKEGKKEEVTKGIENAVTEFNSLETTLKSIKK